jgi:hypothetical protein
MTTSKESIMIIKKVLVADRIRRIDGGFSFIPHRFLMDGFLEALSQPELLLYIFLILAADRYGLSYYSYDRICSLLQFSLEQYIEARNGLINKDLIAGRPLRSPVRKACQPPARYRANQL